MNGRDPTGLKDYSRKAARSEAAGVQALLDAGWKVLHGGPGTHRPILGAKTFLMFDSEYPSRCLLLEKWSSW